MSWLMAYRNWELGIRSTDSRHSPQDKTKLKLEEVRYTAMFRIMIIMLLCTSVYAQKQDRVDVQDYEGFKSTYLVEQDELVVFNFWATWCKPCVAEMPYFIELAAEHDIRLVLVSLDFPQHLHSKVIPFLEEKGIEQEVVLLNERDANVFVNDIDSGWQGSIPATLLWKDIKLGFAEKEFHSTTELLEFINKKSK